MAPIFYSRRPGYNVPGIVTKSIKSINTVMPDLIRHDGIHLDSGLHRKDTLWGIDPSPGGGYNDI